MTPPGAEGDQSPGNALSTGPESGEDGGLGGLSQASSCGVSLTADPFRACEFISVFRAVLLPKATRWRGHNVHMLGRIFMPLIRRLGSSVSFL